MSAELNGVIYKVWLTSQWQEEVVDHRDILRQLAQREILKNFKLNTIASRGLNVIIDYSVFL